MLNHFQIENSVRSLTPSSDMNKGVTMDRVTGRPILALTLGANATHVDKYN
jgi:hypothetical protein